MRRIFATKLSTMRLALMVSCFLLAGCGVASRDAASNGDRAPEDRSEHQYACGSGATFTASDVAAARPPNQAVLAAIEELRGTMDAAFLPESGWIEVGSEEGGVALIAPLGDAYASARFEQEDGEWSPSGWGDCLPRLQVPGRSVLRWAFTKDSYPPAPEATELDVLVNEVECSSGRDIDGLIESSISYEEDSVSVTLTAPALSGGQNCLGTRPTNYTIHLDEPLDSREVVDPSVYPAVEPTPGTRLP